MQNNFTEQEKREAKANGFILAGKTGAGKSTLINAISDQNLAIAAKQNESCTKDTTSYYYRMQNGKCICLVDTPGLCDTDKINKQDIDKIHLESIQKTLEKEQIQIKGILFLLNFHNERFDDSEQEALIDYNRTFPLPDFWEHLILIFTHYFFDPDGDSEEQIKNQKNETNGKLYMNLMKRVEKVSKVIDYKNLEMLNANSHFPISKSKEKTQREANKKTRDKLEVMLNKFISKGPLFTQVEICPIKNFSFQKNGKTYVTTANCIGFFDLGHIQIGYQLIVDEEHATEFKKEIPIPKSEPQIDKIKVVNSDKDKSGNLVPQSQKGTTKNSNFARMAAGGLASGVIAGAASGYGLATFAACETGQGLIAAGTAAGATFGETALATILGANPIGVGIGVGIGVCALVAFIVYKAS